MTSVHLCRCQAAGARLPAQVTFGPPAVEHKASAAQLRLKRLLCGTTRRADRGKPETAQEVGKQRESLREDASHKSPKDQPKSEK